MMKIHQQTFPENFRFQQEIRVQTSSCSFITVIGDAIRTIVEIIKTAKKRAVVEMVAEIVRLISDLEFLIREN
jgi:hypothetical protein